MTEYDPAESELAIEVLPPVGNHEYVYPEVPPETKALAVPSLPPLHDASVPVEVDESGSGWVIVVELVVLQPLASVTVT